MVLETYAPHFIKTADKFSFQGGNRIYEEGMSKDGKDFNQLITLPCNEYYA